MTKSNGTFINSPWHLAVAVRISLGARLEITGFLLHWCIMHAENGSVVSVHGRPGAPLLHVICNASVQWALFLVKRNYPHKTEPRTSRLSTKEESTDEPQRERERECVCGSHFPCAGQVCCSCNQISFSLSRKRDGPRHWPLPSRQSPNAHVRNGSKKNWNPKV